VLSSPLSGCIADRSTHTVTAALVLCCKCIQSLTLLLLLLLLLLWVTGMRGRLLSSTSCKVWTCSCQHLGCHSLYPSRDRSSYRWVELGLELGFCLWGLQKVKTSAGVLVNVAH
jgi:hypothetical protein